jgi:hypothetical protein
MRERAGTGAARSKIRKAKRLAAPRRPSWRGSAGRRGPRARLRPRVRGSAGRAPPGRSSWKAAAAATTYGSSVRGVGRSPRRRRQMCGSKKKARPQQQPKQKKKTAPTRTAMSIGQARGRPARWYNGHARAPRIAEEPRGGAAAALSPGIEVPTPPHLPAPWGLWREAAPPWAAGPSCRPDETRPASKPPPATRVGVEASQAGLQSPSQFTGRLPPFSVTVGGLSGRTEANFSVRSVSRASMPRSNKTCASRPCPDRRNGARPRAAS